MPKEKKDPVNEKDEQFKLPIYKKEDDIYARDEEVPLEEDDTTSLDMDLDVPGAEEDDQDEIIGEEDEENNYYSLGGDNHEDLEEDKSE